jgi:NADPH:quinone reductase-like Zn-dependent oxidoreductase
MPGALKFLKVSRNSTRTQLTIAKLPFFLPLSEKPARFRISTSSTVPVSRRRYTHNLTTAMPSNPVFKSGNTALITGGASGIGLALATKCAGYGMNVIICDNNNSNLSSAKSAIKGNVETVNMDVSRVEDFEKLKVQVEKDFGGNSTFEK